MTAKAEFYQRLLSNKPPHNADMPNLGFGACGFFTRNSRPSLIAATLSPYHNTNCGIFEPLIVLELVKSVADDMPFPVRDNIPQNSQLVKYSLSK